jgi:hypothetical protein
VSTTAEDLHQAIADVLQAHGYGMVSRLAFVVELVDEETGGRLRATADGAGIGGPGCTD